MNEKNRGIFYGVVAVATLIVAIVGATLAYFSIYASSPENEVGFTSRVVSIDYVDGQNIVIGNDIIPSAYNFVVKAYENNNRQEDKGVCIDDNDQKICSVYQFTIRNNADQADLEMYLKVGLNEFTNLKYMLYEINGNTKTNVYSSIPDMQTNEELSYSIDSNTVGQRFSIAGYDNNGAVSNTFTAGQTKTFELVLYLNETGNPQNEEQGKSFAGTIEVEIAGQITGYVQ